jgi:autotransporter-associated beta strand protein
VTSTTLASDIQSDLNALGNIGGVGGSVTVSQAAYQTITIPAGATGTFTLSFTGNNAAGASVTDVTTLLSLSSTTLITDLENALDALTNIGGVNAFVTVLEPSAGVFTVEFNGSLTGKFVQLLAVNNTAVANGPITVANTFSISFGGALIGEDLQTLTTKNLTLVGGSVVAQTSQIGTSITVPNALNLSGSGIDKTGALLDVGGSDTWSGAVTLDVMPGFTPFTLTTGTVALGAGQYDTVTISGQVSEEPSEAPNIPSGEVPLGIIKVGAGTVALSNANTYTGSTEVSQGILDVQNPNALGNRVTANGLVTIEQLITLSDSKGGEFTLSFDGKNASQALGFGASSSAVQKVLAGSSSGGGGLFAAAGFVNADVQVYRTAIQTTTDNGPSPTDPPSAVTGWIYTLIFEGGTTSYNFAQTPIQLEANGVKGTFASTSIVALGGVDAIVDNNTNGTGELELGNPLTPNTPLVVSKYTLTLNGSGPTGAGALYNLVGDNTWSGPIILAANDALIPPAVTQIGVGVAPATSTTPSSLSLTDVKALSIPVGSVVPVEPELDKLDAGTLIFPSGASFTGTTQYSLTNSPIDLGVTLITAGDVQVDSTVNSTSSPPSGVGPILLNGGTLSGNGSVQSVKNATTNPTGTIDPGDNYPSEASGLLTSSGNVVPYDVTLSSKDTYYVNLGVPTNTNLPPSSTDNNDVLDVTGTIYLGGATLDGLVNTNVAEDDSYTIIKAGNIIGEFVNEGPTNITPVESGALAASVSYIDGVKFEVDYFATRVDVIRELAQVSLALTPSIASPVYGQDEQFVAKLTPETGAPAPTGTVVFKVVDPNGVISTYDVTLPTSPATGSATLDIASVLDAPLIEGGLGYTVTASYNGIDANGNHTFTQLSNIPMTPATITVEPANSTTSLALNFPQPEVYGETFTLTATVATTVASPVINTLAPAGYVSFTDGTTLLGNVFLTSPPPGTTTATAVLSSSTLSVLPIAGNHTIVATYYPNASPDNYSGSANSVGLSIQQDATTVTVTTPPLSPAPVYGQAGVVFTATVTPVSPGGGDPTGNVTFRDGALVLGMGTLSTTNGVTTATYTTTSGQLAEGVNSITATYYGDTNFTGNTGSLSETTTRASSSTTLMSSAPNGIAYGQTVTFTATVAAVYPGGGTPTGTVAFYDGTTLLGDGSLNTVNNLTTATYTTLPFQLPVGSVTLPTNQFITATYLGDGNFTGSTSPALTQEITLASSTTSVNTSGPSVYGQAVTLTATVRPTLSGGVTPTGTVTFYVAGNPNPVGTATLATTGGITTARYTTTLGQLPVGVNETITAVYSGDSHYGSSSGTTSQTVTQDSTTTTVVSSGAAIPGDAITLTSEVVANSPGGGIPTGTVSFTVGSALLGTASLVDINGVTIAQLNVLSSAFPVGPDTVVATYTGDTNFSGSSGSVAESVEDRTTTTVTTSLPAAIYGEPVSLTATIAPITAATLTPSGTVTFMVGNTVLGTATVGTVNGVTSAVLTLTNLPVGTNQTINGFYSGDGIFIGSSGSVLQTVSKTATHTTLVSTLSSIELDQAIILTAQVFPTAPGGGTPTGTITFKDNGTVLGTATLTSGVASLKKAITIVGTNKITAVYGGDTNDLTSTSPVLNVVVGALGTRAMTVKLASSLNPSLVDQSVSFTATVTDGGSGAAHTPTGTVSFYNGTTLLGYATLSGSGRVAKAVFTDATLPQGTDGIVAVYNGSGLFERGGSATLKQVVNAVPDRASGITLVANPTATTYGSPILFSATVSDEGSGAAQTPTGAVTFTATNLATFAVINMGNGTLTGANGIATTTLSYANLPVGTYSINATYNGDGSFYQEGNQSSVVIETVTQGTTAVSLSSSLPNGSFYGQAVTFTATVSVPGSTAAPAGAVSFVNETTGANYGTFAIGANGIVTLKTAALSTGSDEIVATYTGSSNSTTSSASLDQAVYQDASTVTLSTTGNSNAPLTMTAYVAAALPGGGTPTGSVDFYIDGGLVGTEPVNGSNPIVYTYEPGVSTGVHTIEAVYNGDQNFTGNNATVTKTFVVGRQT